MMAYFRKSPSVGLIMIDDVLFRGFVNGKGIKNGGEIGLVVAIEAEQRGQESGTLKQNTFVFDSQC